jgi:hypothetical protein
MERHFKIEPLDPAKLIKINDLKEIKNPVFFDRNNSPTSDGLLSNDIFGITKDDRAGTFAYIDLQEYFINPIYYKIWSRMDSKVVEIVHGTKKFSIDKDGYFVEDENGKNGIKFLKDNIDIIKFKSTDSLKRDINIEFLTKKKQYMFIKQMPVIPAYYRDVYSGSGNVGVGEVNKLYNALIIAVRSLKESSDYGLTLSNSVRGRIQEYIMNIYNWFGTEPNIPKKMGIIKRAVNSKTADYASRLVLSAPQLKVENLDDLMVDLDHSAVPLASLCVNFYSYVVFYIRRFFENEFAGDPYYSVMEKDGSISKLKVKDYQIAFSDANIKKQLERFIHGYSNRFIPIEVPVEDEKKKGKVYMQFKGYNTSEEEFAKKEPGTLPIMNRRLTWCDLIYQACVEASKDKCILITRYPIDSYYNQFPTMIVVSSTKVTEPMIINGNFFKHYPKIREEDIGTDTSNRFIDTLNICNAYLKAIVGDYDGDQVTVKGAYTIEANKELSDYLNSKAHYISLGAQNVRLTSNEGIQSLYNLTMALPGTKLTENVS